MNDKMRNETLRNENVRVTLCLAPIKDKMRGNRLKWFGYINI